MALTDTQRAVRRKQVIAQRLRKQELLAAEFEKLPPEVRRRRIRRYGRNKAKLYVDDYIKRGNIAPLSSIVPFEKAKGKIDVLFLSHVDYAGLGYALARSLKSIGVKAVATTTRPLSARSKSDQAPTYNRTALIKAVSESYVIVWMHSYYQSLPRGILRDKKCVVLHGGTRYRRSPKRINQLFKDRAHLSLIQTGELLGKGARNEHWLLPPVDTKGIKPDYSFKSKDKIIIGHFTSHVGGSRASLVKGTPLIMAVIQSLKKGKFGNRFEFRSGTSSIVPWKANLHRVAGCDIYIESLSQGSEANKNKHDWSIAALEACALGCITVTNFLFEKRYKKEYGTHGLIVANTGKALKKALEELLSMAVSYTHLRAHET